MKNSEITTAISSGTLSESVCVKGNEIDCAIGNGIGYGKSYGSGVVIVSGTEYGNRHGIGCVILYGKYANECESGMRKWLRDL